MTSGILDVSLAVKNIIQSSGVFKPSRKLYNLEKSFLFSADIVKSTL
jgi:hypothetical protein